MMLSNGKVATMPDKKLTDNEIKKALGVCCTKIPCKECIYMGNKELCVAENTTAVLDLINRLQAENEELKREIEDLESVQEISPEAKYLVDTKADKVISLLTEINKSQEQIKAEAYKECIEKVKEKSAKYNWVSSGALLRTEYTIGENTLDNLLKEMEGSK